MAEIRPLRALHYDTAVVGPLADVTAPPYDVIDAEQRAALLARSPHNIVAIDLPEGEPDRYASAAGLLETWQLQGALVRDSRARDLGTRSGLHRARWAPADPARVLLPGAHRGVRSRTGAPARAHASRPEGGPAAR